MKAFLSHSSKQKFYVEQVAKILKKENIFYDSWTFEEGSKTIEEIYSQIEKSGLFVLFISKESLESDWVKQEIFLAENLIRNNSNIKFLPIIIDNNLTYKHEGIPEWMRPYNIKLIQKPSRAAFIIKEKISTALANLTPEKIEEKQLFIGRNRERQEFENEYYDRSKTKPLCLVLSGLSDIGRKKFIKKILIDSNVIKEYYNLFPIYLDRRNSIEDLISQLYILGYTDHSNDLIDDLIEKNIDQKVQICADIIKKITEIGEIITISDNNCIFTRTGSAPWFISLINHLSNENDLNKDIKICIISSKIVKNSWRDFENNSLLNITLREFSTPESSAYFEKLLKIYDIELTKADFEKYLANCRGIPGQIKFLVNLIKKNENKDTEIIQYTNNYIKDKFSPIIDNYLNDNLSKQLLKLLSIGEFFSNSLIHQIFENEDKSRVNEILQAFNDDLLLETIIDGMDYIKLTDSAKDYIERLNYTLDDKYQSIIRSHINNVSNLNLEYDFSEKSFYVKQALKADKDVPIRNIIPSFYINAMRELYNYEKKYNAVVKLADKILEYKDSLDRNIIREIQYWCCLALARLRDKKILRYVQDIDGIEHNFLLGFYYRLIGRNDEAIERFKKVLSEDPQHFRSKRELVQVYLNTELYTEAFELAKQNYESDTSNPYYIQSYFKCLIKNEQFPERDIILENLLEHLRNSSHEKSNEMYMTSNAQYYAYIKDNIDRALQLIDDAIATFPNNIYPYLIKLEIIRNKPNLNSTDFTILAETITSIENKFEKESDIYNKLIFLITKILVLKNHLLNQYEAQVFFDKYVKNNFPDKIKNDIQNLIQANRSLHES